MIPQVLLGVVMQTAVARQNPVEIVLFAGFISTWLQPGEGNSKRPRKPCKRFLAFVILISTWLKPGANGITACFKTTLASNNPPACVQLAP